METIRRALNNRNIILSSLIILASGILLICWIFNLFTNSIQERERLWETTLKFNTDNSKEFPYAILTQQGNLYAEGPLYEASPLVTNDKIEGEWLAIKEYREEYRMHTETYSCNCKTVNEVTTCQTCTRTYWSWDFDGIQEQTVDKVALLSQEMNSNLFSWKNSWIHQNTKEGKYHYYYDSHHRSSFSTIARGVEVKQGFRSDESGLKAIEVSPNNAENLRTCRIALTIFLSILLIIGVGCWIYFGYEYIDTYIK